MRELTVLGKNKLKWVERDELKITSPKSAILRPLVSSRCDGDSLFLFHNYSELLKLGVKLHYLDRRILETFGNNPIKPPFCVGHECIGEITEIGSDVTNFKVGDVVIVPWAISCGTCKTCNDGYYSNCNNTNDDAIISAYGFGHNTSDYGGTMSDFITIPFADGMLIHLPEDINPYHCSALSDNISDAYRTIAPHIQNNPQAPVLVIGGAAQSIGLYAVYFAKILGSSHIDYIDQSKTRLRIAESLGANPIPVNSKIKFDTFHKSLLKNGYPITVDCSGEEPKLNLAIRSLASGGFCTSTAFYFKKGTKLPLWEMYTKSASFHIGISHPRRDIPKILPLIQSGALKPEKVITTIADWEEAEQAYLEKTTKLVVRRDPYFEQNLNRFKEKNWI
ncbi:MAG: alcohol dehydrogenase catalytic domain-containing protein [Chitinophagales bacterium]|nr:alcohol dehydrogenase catalytic domain-containing protein [Chitinophagales bacterium]